MLAISRYHDLDITRVIPLFKPYLARYSNILILAFLGCQSKYL